MVSNGLGSKLKQLRLRSGLTQQELASKAEIAYSTLSKIEQGKIKTPSAALLSKLVKVLRYDLDELLNGKPLPALPFSRANALRPAIKFIFLDIHGVLIRWQPALQAFSLRLNRPLHEVNAFFWTYNALASRGKLNLYDLQLLYLLKFNVRYQAARREKLFRHWALDMKPMTEMHEFVTDLAQKYPVGLLTNIIPGFYDEYRRLNLIPDLPYKAVIKSCDTGFIKPEVEIYQLASKVAKTNPAQILLIDDTKMNVSRARELGWQAEWFNEHKPVASIERIRRKYF